MQQLTREQQTVLAAIDEEELVADLVEMVRVPSVTGSDAESELQHMFAADLEDLGLDVDVWRLDLEALALPGIESGWIGAEGLRLRPDYWSGIGGMDGFFVTLFRRAG